MQELKDIISYFLKFQKNNSITNGRLINLVYLADWRNVIFHKTPISPIDNWNFLTSTRIYSNQILGEALLNQDIFNIDYGLDLYRPESVIIKLKKNSNVKFNFSENEIASLSHVIKTVSDYSDNDLYYLVSCTYPVMNNKMPLASCHEPYKEYCQRTNERKVVLK